MATIVNARTKQKIGLNRYTGEWVAFLANKIIAHHKNLGDLMKEIDQRNLRKKVSIFLVPRKDEGPYVLPTHQSRGAGRCGVPLHTCVPEHTSACKHGTPNSKMPRL